MTELSDTGMFIDIYRSTRHADMYLFLPGRAQLSEVPAELQKRFGPATRTLSLWLTADTGLARAEPVSVLTALRNTGWYLQMPPGTGDTESVVTELARQVTARAEQSQ